MAKRELCEADQARRASQNKLERWIVILTFNITHKAKMCRFCWKPKTSAAQKLYQKYFVSYLSVQEVGKNDAASAPTDTSAFKISQNFNAFSPNNQYVIEFMYCYSLLITLTALFCLS